GNPPWVSFGLRGVEKIEKKFEDYFRKNFPNSAEYKLSLYAIFMNRAVDLMNNKALFGFILPDSFLLGRYFSKIRRYILDETSIMEILMIVEDFWPHGSVGRSVIILLQKERDEITRRNNKSIVKLCPTLDDLGKRNFKIHSYIQEYFNNIPYNRFRLFFDKQSKDFVDNQEKGAINLKDIVSIHTGVRSKIGQKNIISPKKESETWHKGLISGSEIGKYRLKWNGNFINIEPSKLWSGGWDPEIILNDKLIMRQTGDSVYATFDSEKYYHLNNCHSIALKNPSYNLKYILAILNSKLMNHYYHLISLELGRAMAQTDIETIELLPIKPATPENQKELVDLVDNMLLLNNQKQELLNSFWALCQNRKTGEKSLLEMLANQNIINAIESKNINLTTWGDKKYDTFEVEAEGNKILIKNLNDTLMEIVFNDSDLALYTYFVIKHYFEQGRLGNKTLRGLCEYIVIPLITNPEIELKKQIIEELRKKFQNIELPLIMKKITDTDTRIDKLVYDVYSITKEESALIEEGLRGDS
ncbi:MAG: TaqI-like C-terminal specificity domain-containing protein, partial [Candidatus Methanoperedens sp.]|nr:TaqI-like C-terminal specificity domain-containing protein [Candidatus Methanoperedens sp.]